MGGIMVCVFFVRLVTPSGLTSIPAGLETPEMIQLRKKKIEEAMEQRYDNINHPAIITVLLLQNNNIILVC